MRDFCIFFISMISLLRSSCVYGTLKCCDLLDYFLEVCGLRLYLLVMFIFLWDKHGVISDLRTD